MTFAEERHKQYFTWKVASAGTINAAGGSTTSYQLGSKETNMLGLYPSVEILFSFTGAATNANTSNDLKLPANTLTFITVPKATRVGGSNLHAKQSEITSVFFNYLAVGSSAGTLRIVEC